MYKFKILTKNSTISKHLNENDKIYRAESIVSSM